MTFNEVDVCLGRTLLRSRELSINFRWFVVTRLTLTFKLKVYFRRLTTLMMVVMMMFTTGKFDINFRVFVVTITVSFKRSFEVSVVMWGVDIEGSRVVFVFVFGSAFFTNINFFFSSAARTVFRTAIFFTGDANLFFYKLLSLGRRGKVMLLFGLVFVLMIVLKLMLVLRVKRLSVLFLTFPSDALVMMV